MLRDFQLGIRTTFQAFNFVFKNKMGHYFLYPLAITVLLLVLAKNFIEVAVDFVKVCIYDWTGLSALETDPSGFFDWIQLITEKTVALILWILLYYLTHKILKYVTLILMSPIMAFLSEKTEKVLTGNDYPFDMQQFLKDIWRGIILAIRNFVVEFSIVIIIWILNTLLGMVPGLNFLLAITVPLSAILTFIVGAYFYGFATIDYTNERRKLSVKDSVQFMRNNKWLAIGNGVLFMLFISIPIIGTYLGPIFATILCTAGATIAIHEKIGLDSQENYILFTKKERENKGSGSI